MAQHPWFRLYSEFSTDPKVQSMPEHMQRRLIMLFCLRCCNTDATLRQRDELLLQQEMCCALRITPEDLSETKILFIKKNFINEDWELLNWDKRQFLSDSSTPRSKKHRDRKRDESKSDNPFKEPPPPPLFDPVNANVPATLQERSQNGVATPPDTDTDTDTDTEERTVVEKTTGSVVKPNGIHPVSARWGYLTDPEFAPFVVAACEYWPDLIEEDLQKSWQFTWKRFDFGQKLDVLKRLRARIDAGEPAHFVARPPKYLEEGDWKRPPRKPKPNGATPPPVKPFGCPICKINPCVCFERQLAREAASSGKS